MHKLDLHYVTMSLYDEKFKGVHVMYSKDNLTNTLGAVLEANNKKQIRIAETEKYHMLLFSFLVVERKNLKERKGCFVLLQK